MRSKERNDRLEAVLPIRDVTLMEDRARVVRRAAVELPSGVTNLVITGLSPVLADKTLQATVGGEGDRAAKALSSEVHRQHQRVEALPDHDHRQLQAQLNELNRQLTLLYNQIDRCNTELSMLHELGQQTVAEISHDAKWGKAEPDGWNKALTAVDEDAFENIERAQALKAKRDELQKQIYVRQQELAIAAGATDEFSCHAEVLMESSAAGCCELEISYTVPAACWRPCHVATLLQNSDGQSHVEIESLACVWQVTGEDWLDVQLHFSTQRPSLGVDPPELQEDLLRVQKKPETVTVEARDQQIQTAGFGRASEVQTLPGIEDGGEPLNLRAADLADIPGDGRPYRVSMHSMTSDAHVDLVCMPELAAAAILRSQLSNQAKVPLLAGPVELIRNHGNVGRTRLSFVAPGEDFELGWGPDPEIRVKHWLDEEEMKSNMLSTWHEQKRCVKNRLSNLGAAEKTIKLSERVPVSEVEQVSIKFHEKETRDQKKPDENGILAWEISLDAFGRADCDLAYTVRKKRSVEGI